MKLKNLMCRTIVPHRWIYEHEKQARYKRLRKNSLLPSTKELFEGGQYFTDAGSNWGTGQVFDKVLFLILFNQYKTLKKLEDKL